MKEVIVYGSGGHAKVIIDIIEKSGEYSIKGLIDDAPNYDSVFGYKILGGFSDLLQIAPGVAGGVVAIGDNCTRAKVVEKIKQHLPDFNFITPTHPNSIIARGVSIGVGTAIMAGAIINSDSSIGEHCIISTNCSIDHDCKIDSFSAIFPGATLAGDVSIGKFSTVSLGANVIHGIKLGENCVIGAGSTILSNIPDNSLAYGTPCRVIKQRKFGDPYLG